MKDKKKIIAIVIAIVAVIAIIAGSTYAYWQITKTQETPNDIVAACLSLDLQDKTSAIDLDSAWPISDEEANNLTGYTFTVTNNCDEEINYIVGLNRVEEDNYLQDTSVKVRLDDNSSHVYGELSNVEYSDPSNAYTSRISKQVSVETIGAKGINEHTIRVWVSSDAPVTEQSKIFKGQVFITGGQGIEVKECYKIANDGTLIGYDYSCGLEVKVPAIVNGIKVKQINRLSLTEYDAANIVISDDSSEKGYRNILLIMDLEKQEQFLELAKIAFCENSSACNLEENGFTILYGIDGYNSVDWENYFVDEIYPVKVDVENNTFTVERSKVTTLDMSEAIYLETIAYGAFCISDGNVGDLELVILPGSIKTVGDNAFGANPNLTEIIIKRDASDPIDASWPSGVTITYNPNYTE